MKIDFDGFLFKYKQYCFKFMSKSKNSGIPYPYISQQRAVKKALDANNFKLAMKYYVRLEHHAETDGHKIGIFIKR